MWRTPVTLGGGSTIVNGGRSGSGDAPNTPLSSHCRYQRSSMSCGWYAFASSSLIEFLSSLLFHAQDQLLHQVITVALPARRDARRGVQQGVEGRSRVVGNRRRNEVAERGEGRVEVKIEVRLVIIEQLGRAT